MNFSARTRPTCARRSWPSWGCRRKRSGAPRLPPDLRRQEFQQLAACSMLWACLLFPSLPLDVFARAIAPDDARPFVVASGGHYPRVVAANAAARAAGIRAEQLVSSALALAPELVLRDRDSDAQTRALAQLATMALMLTPMACLAPPNAIVADIGGSLRLFGGLPRVVARLVGGACALGYATQVGIAPTPGAALLLARAGHTQPVTEPAQLPAALAPISLMLVDLDDA